MKSSTACSLWWKFRATIVTLFMTTLALLLGIHSTSFASAQEPSPTTGPTPSGGVPAPPSLADLIVWATVHHPFFRCVRNHESSNHPPLYMEGVRAENPSSTASGLYQFLDSTWRNSWRNSARTTPPTARASQADAYTQSLLAGIVFIHGGQHMWRGAGCGYGT